MGIAGLKRLITVFQPAALCACLFLAGCDSETSLPELPVREVHQWSMPPEETSIPAPRGMTFGPQQELYVLDNAGRVLVFDRHGKLIRKWFMPEYTVGKPEGIWIFRDGRIGVADTHYHRVVFFNANGDVLGMHGSLGEQPGQFIYPVALVQDHAGNYYVGEYGGNDRIQKFSEDGRFLLSFGAFGTEAGQFQRPSGLVWRDGMIYVADAINNRIQVFRDTGELVGPLSFNGQTPPLHYPYNLARGPDDDLFVIEYGAGRVTRLSLTGQVLGTFGSDGSQPGQFHTPWGLAVDETGRIMVADTGNRRMVELQR
jgi:DNA-binding beta-propeller fold protein YncE